MIQRIQSIYLIIVTVVNVLAVFLVADHLEEIADVIASFHLEYQLFFAFVLLLALCTLFSFKKRDFQMLIGKINFILNFVALGFLVYWLLILPGEINFSEKGIGLAIPVISIVFIVLAQKAIKRDDELVKSADRFR